MEKKITITVKDITLMALLATLLFVQEEALTFLPNVQLTIFLIVLYSKIFGFLRTSIITCTHVLLDNLVMGSLNFIFIPFMLLGWLIIPITMCTIFKKIESNISLAFLGILYAFIYSWIFIIPGCLVLQTSFVSYLVADIFFELMLAMSSFLSILLLYKPVSSMMDRCLKWSRNQS